MLLLHLEAHSPTTRDEASALAHASDHNPKPNLKFSSFPPSARSIVTALHLVVVDISY
jgi:hypothetical protein